MHVGLQHYLTVSFLLFSLGLLGVIMRRNLLVIYMSLELMLNAANLALVSFSRFNDNWTARCWCSSSSPWRRRKFRSASR
jgi:NADH-quinone oxidoreductase subunit K